MSVKDSIYSESAAYAFFKSFLVPSLRPAFCECIPSIFFNFFLRQYRAALLPGRVPVSRVDHPLDAKIPFIPSWVTIYLDFAAFWIRMLSFLLHRYKRRAYGPVRDFIFSMGRLYAFAAETYRKNFSTTDRPFYIARPRFLVIHLLDPHLMCVPSLHVMVVIHTYTMLAVIARAFGDEEKLIPQIREMKQGALAISQAVLFVKQHSVNCISAALYAMTCFDPVLFPPEEAEAFTALLFGQSPAPDESPDGDARLLPNYKAHPSASPKTRLLDADRAEIRAHILGLYRQFLSEKTQAKNWDEPLLDFMRPLQRVKHTG